MKTTPQNNNKTHPKNKTTIKANKTPQQTHSFGYVGGVFFVCLFMYMVIVYLRKQRFLQEWFLHRRIGLISLPLMTSPYHSFGFGLGYFALATQHLWPREPARHDAGVLHTKCRV